MKDKKIIYIIFGALFIGLTIGVLLSRQQVKKVDDIDTPRTNLPTEEPIYVTEGTPFPTFPPLKEKIKRIEADKIIVEGERGEMSIPKNPDMVKVYIRGADGNLIPSSFDAIKVGQNATLVIVVPRQRAELIIEGP